MRLSPQKTIIRTRLTVGLLEQKKLWLKDSDSFSSLSPTQILCYSNISLLHICRWSHKSTNQSCTYVLKVCLEEYAVFSKKLLLWYIICVLLKICSGPLKKFWLFLFFEGLNPWFLNKCQGLYLLCFDK